MVCDTAAAVDAGPTNVTAHVPGQCDVTVTWPVSEIPLATENLLENTDGVGAPHLSFSGRQPATIYIVMLTCALLMTSSHSKASTHFGSLETLNL